MTCRPNMTPRKLPHGWTPHACNSGNGTSAGQRSWHKNNNASFQNPNPTSPENTWATSSEKQATEASRRYAYKKAQ